MAFTPEDWVRLAEQHLFANNLSRAKQCYFRAFELLRVKAFKDHQLFVHTATMLLAIYEGTPESDQFIGKYHEQIRQSATVLASEHDSVILCERAGADGPDLAGAKESLYGSKWQSSVSPGTAGFRPALRRPLSCVL